MNDCTDTCFDALEASSSLENDADSCAECIDTVACNEVSSQCPRCQNVFDSFSGD